LAIEVLAGSWRYVICQLVADHGAWHAQARDKIVNLHMIHTLCADHQHVLWFCLSGMSFVTSYERLRPTVGKVAAAGAIGDAHPIEQLQR
jgi:hypothetical protein